MKPSTPTHCRSKPYQCAFYGGALLARVQFKSEEEAEDDLVNLIRINPNVVVVCDSDKTGPKSRIKGRVRRICSEVRKIPGAYVWVTDAREIENYVPGELIAKACSRDPVADPEQFEDFFPRKGLSGKSYIERRLGRKTLDKMDLASSIRKVAAPGAWRTALRHRFQDCDCGIKGLAWAHG